MRGRGDEESMASKKKTLRGQSLADFVADVSKKHPEFGETYAFEYNKFIVARHLRELREAKNLSQADLAKRVGTKQPQIARIELGKNVPRLDILQRMAHALGVRLTVALTPLGAEA